MTLPTPLIPRQATPSLDLKLVGGGSWSLADQAPENFTMIVVYRGYHCPICSRYLADLNRKAADFAEIGVNILVLSSDTQERGEKAKEEWKLDNLELAYGLTLEKAREWGLFISTSKGATSSGVIEPDLFVEPGLFLVRPNQELFFSTIQTMPFARPAFSEILGACKFVIEKDYPGRGEVIDF